MKKTSHGIMFHHFHNKKHLKGQGSINSLSFERILDYLQKNYNLIGSDEYSEKVFNKKLGINDVCLTFDDALLSQYEIAVPILKKRCIKSFFFIYSSPFYNKPEKLEVFRYFRNICYDNIDLFYNDFFLEFEIKNPNKLKKIEKNFSKLNYLDGFPFYSYNDKLFRYLRDKLLLKKEYELIMQNLMRKKEFNVDKIISVLWMKNDHLIKLREDGHIIGLHSFNHPTVMKNLTFDQKKFEFNKNLNHLKEILINYNVQSMSHPCGNYDTETLEILKDLNIQIGFRSNMKVKYIKSNLEIPREDHINILNKIDK